MTNHATPFDIYNFDAWKNSRKFIMQPLTWMCLIAEVMEFHCYIGKDHSHTGYKINIEQPTVTRKAKK